MIIFHFIPLVQDAITIFKGDLKKLAPEEYLNDNLIDLKIKHLAATQLTQAAIHVFNCVGPEAEEQVSQEQLPPVCNSSPRVSANTTPASTSQPPESWLATRLILNNMQETLALDCEQKLVSTEGFSNVRDFAECPPSMFHRAYLTGIGITGLGTQQQLLRLHSELHAQYQLTISASTPLSPTTVPAPQKTTGDVTAYSDSSCNNISASSIRLVKNNYSAITAGEPTNNNKRARSNSWEYNETLVHQFVPDPPSKKSNN